MGRILDVPTWERVRAVLTDPARERVRAKRSSLLSGLLRCGACSHPRVAAPRVHPELYRLRESRSLPTRMTVAARQRRRLELDWHPAEYAFRRTDARRASSTARKRGYVHAARVAGHACLVGRGSCVSPRP
jgi:hypothetical protein